MSKKNFTVRQRFEMDACTGCRLCADVCPAACAAANGELTAVYRMQGLKRKLKAGRGLRRFFGPKPPDPQELKRFAETVFRCTLCGRCGEVCPIGIRLQELWHAARQDLVDGSAYPEKIDLIRKNLAESRNVFGEDNAERAEWVEDMRRPPKHGYNRETAEVAYITGCVAAYFPLAQKIPVALAEIFDASGVDFTILGEEEWCCGFPLLGAGLMGMFEDFRRQNLRAVEAKGARTVVFACPSCYQMWREHYRCDLDLVSAPEYLLRLLARGPGSACARSRSRSPTTTPATSAAERGCSTRRARRSAAYRASPSSRWPTTAKAACAAGAAATSRWWTPGWPRASPATRWTRSWPRGRRRSSPPASSACAR